MRGPTTIKSSQAVVIDRDTPIYEIAHQLTARGCKDLTGELNPLSLTTQPVANGGFGDVYRGELLDGRRVAIKTLRLPSSSEPEENIGKLLKRAARELYVWSKCRHPNVLPLLGLVEFHNQLRMISLWMDNGNLPSYLARNPHLSRHSMSTHVCEGLVYLHHNEIVHGDLKGSNVLVSNDGVPMINDFGNAVHHGTLAIADTTQKNCNTPQWTAPEVMDERESGNTREADVYSLGMTILVRDFKRGAMSHTNLQEHTGDNYGENALLRKEKSFNHAVYIAKIVRKEIPARPERYISSSTPYGNKLWSLLKSCWLNEPKERPSALLVTEYMQALVLEESLKFPIASQLQPTPSALGSSQPLAKPSKRLYEQSIPDLASKRVKYQPADFSIPQNPDLLPQDAGGRQMWNGQIVYLLRLRDDQAPAQLHFHAIAVGELGQNIDTNKWPSRLLPTSGFKVLPRNMAGQLYASALPFGQIIIDPAHSATDQQKHAVFHKVITAGYSIFYEFPHDPTNPLPPNAPPGSARGLLFFSTPNAPTQMLFKVFINQLCPPVFCRGGQPAGPGLIENNANGTGAASVANGGGAGSTPVAVPGAGMGLPVAGLGGLPNEANNMLGNQPRNPVPGAGRPNPTSTPPAANVGDNPNREMGINPAMIQGSNEGGIPELGSAAMPGLAPTDVPRLGEPGLGLGNIPGLAQGNVPGMNPGNVPRPNPTGLNIAQNPQHTAIFHMALARLGFTPAQYTSATVQEKEQIIQQVQRVVKRANLHGQQRQQATAVANGMGMAGMANRPVLAPGQPGFEQLQAYMWQQ